ncbi:MAG: hypothetical protein WC846_01090 [Candidatus Gracilibacteria bacterium]
MPRPADFSADFGDFCPEVFDDFSFAIAIKRILSAGSIITLAEKSRVLE